MRCFRPHFSSREESPRDVGLMVLLVLLLSIEYGLYFALAPSRPSPEERFDKELPGGPFANVLGQRGWWHWVYGSALVVALYIAKTAIVFSRLTDSFAKAVYALIIAMCLPLLWIFVTTDWNNAHAELAYWFTLPVGLLTVPTVGFLCDLACRPYRSTWFYVMKTCVEGLLIPVWFALWILIEFVLQFYWI